MRGSDEIERSENCADYFEYHNFSLIDRLCLLYWKIGRKSDYSWPTEYIPLDNPLKPFRNNFDHFDDLIKDKQIIDFGCGKGAQAIALAENGASKVVGVDIDEDDLEIAENRRQDNPYLDKISFIRKLSDEHLEAFDIVISLNSFEHFPDPSLTVSEIKNCLKPGGLFLLLFAPTWLSAYGPHQMDITLSPWPHVLFPEQSNMRVRSYLLNQYQGSCYEELGLNRMTVQKFHAVMKNSGFLLDYCRYRASKGLRFLTQIPIAREFFTSGVTAILRKPA